MHVSLFGSAARGEGDAQSDIDLFIVRAEGVGEKDERWRAQLDLLAKQVQRWTGNRGAIAEIAEAELSRLRADGPPIVDELRSDAITLAGPAITAVLGPA